MNKRSLNIVHNIRSAILKALMDKNDIEKISRILNSVEIGLIVSDNGKNIIATKYGTQIMMSYIEKLEVELFKERKMSISNDNLNDDIVLKVDCKKCLGLGSVNVVFDKKKIQKTCPTCNGNKYIEYEID